MDNRLYLVLVREHLPSLRSIQLLDTNMVSLLEPSQSEPIAHVAHVAVSCQHFDGRNAAEELLVQMANTLAAIFPALRTFDVRCAMFDKSHPHSTPLAALHTFESSMLALLPGTLRRFSYLTEVAFERKAPGEPFVSMSVNA
ncbi:hypothetical protein AURDEDRAFT_162156 [Auricularia subglabra TFB-10046 SS5]|nr:hypothetical protein AURDEDRAFT_162156 [Auricularia subglabra TFB-10046 SS5]